jgi:hypothetical protein
VETGISLAAWKVSVRKAIASDFRRTVLSIFFPFVFALCTGNGRGIVLLAIGFKSGWTRIRDTCARRSRCGTAAVAIYGKHHWWQDGFHSSFHTGSEGWFGQGTYAGGADELGHLYLNYTATRLISRSVRASSLKRTRQGCLDFQQSKFSFVNQMLGHGSRYLSTELTTVIVGKYLCSVPINMGSGKR